MKTDLKDFPGKKDKIDRFVNAFLLEEKSEEDSRHHFNFGQQNQQKDAQEIKQVDCNICLHLKEESSKARDAHRLFLTQEDIDQIELMHPQISPQEYMLRLLQLYIKQSNLKCRERNKEQMRVILEHEKQTQVKSVKFQLVDSVNLGEKVHGMRHQQLAVQQIRQRKLVEKMKETCFIGLGKRIVRQTVKSNKIELSRSNFHTREYLIPHIEEHVRGLRNQNLDAEYIVTNANSKGINFDVDRVPQRLVQRISITKYAQIFFCINQIIQKTVCAQKNMSKANRQISKLWLFLAITLPLVLTFYILNDSFLHSPMLALLSILLAVFSILMILILSLHRFRTYPQRINLMQEIIRNVDHYLSYVNSRSDSSLAWKTSKNLYWIEVKIIGLKNQSYDQT